MSGVKLPKNNITFWPVVEGISRKFVPRKQTARLPMFDGYMGAVSKKVALSGGLGTVRRNYFFIRTAKFETDMSQDAIARRRLFGQVSTAVKSLMRNLDYITYMQMMWMASKDDQSKRVNGVANYGYQSIRDWVWACQYAGKKQDDNYNLNVWPNQFDA